MSSYGSPKVRGLLPLLPSYVPHAPPERFVGLGPPSRLLSFGPEVASHRAGRAEQAGGELDTDDQAGDGPAVGFAEVLKKVRQQHLLLQLFALVCGN